MRLDKSKNEPKSGRILNSALFIPELNSRVLISILLGIALLVRAVLILGFANISPNVGIWEYGRQASCAWRNNSDLCLYFPGSEVSYPSAYMPPFLSYLWLGLFHIFGDGSAARAVWLGASTAAGLGCVALTYYLSFKLIPSRRIAFTAGLLVAVYPTFAFISTTYHQTNWAVLLLLSVVAVAVKLAEDSNPWLWGAAGGVLCALAALNRSEMLFIGPILLAIGAFWSRDWHRVLIVGMTGAILMAAIMMPWVLRNYEYFGRLIPVAQSQGYNMWKGYNPYTNGSGNLSEVRGGQGEEVTRRIVQSTSQGPDYEGRLQDAYFQEFMKDVEDSSAGRLVKLALNKVALFWTFDWTDREVTGRISYIIPWAISNLFALVGLLFAWRSRRLISPAPAAIYSSVALLLTLAYVATSVHARYRMHVEPFIFILVGFGAVGVWDICARFLKPAHNGAVADNVKDRVLLKEKNPAGDHS